MIRIALFLALPCLFLVFSLSDAREIEPEGRVLFVSKLAS